MGLKWHTREITEEQYKNVKERQDASGIFSEAEVLGYGIYQERYYEKDGKYYVDFEMGTSCD